MRNVRVGETFELMPGQKCVDVAHLPANNVEIIVYAENGVRLENRKALRNYDRNPVVLPFVAKEPLRISIFYDYIDPIEMEG